MIFAAILYSQYELKEAIILDETKSIRPLGWAPLRQVREGSWRTGGFKFAYIEKEVDRPSHENIGFTNTNVKLFLNFFSFITGDGWSIQEFEERQESCKHFNSEDELDGFLDNQIENEVRENPPVLESNFSIQYSFRTVIGQIEFPEAWNVFLGRGQEFHDMISVYCSRLAGPHNGVFEVWNKDTIKLFLLITLIEGLLPARSFCDQQFDCSECGKENIQHYPQTTYDYWRFALSEKLHFQDNNEYIELIISLHKGIRNSFAHACSLLPEVDSNLESNAQGAHTRFIHLEDVIKSRDKDDLARLNALILADDIVRFLLLSELYPENINKPWPDLSLLKQFRSN